MNKIINFIIDHAIHLIVVASIAGMIGGIIWFCWTYRVVEYKDYPATATITDSCCLPGHYVTKHGYDTKGNVHTEIKWIPPEYGFYYSIEFEGSTYSEYRTVSEGIYATHHIGDTVPATFRKQWLADGSETYRIYLD